MNKDMAACPRAASYCEAARTAVASLHNAYAGTGGLTL